MDECYDLKQQIEALIKQGKLKKKKILGETTRTKDNQWKARQMNKDHCRRYINRKLV